MHIRENHPGISAEAILGPSPLSIGAAAASQKRALVRKQKEAERLLKLPPLNPLFTESTTSEVDKTESEAQRSENEESQEPGTQKDPNNIDVQASDVVMDEDESSQSSLIATLKRLEEKCGQSTKETTVEPINKPNNDNPEQPNSVEIEK